MNRTAPHPPRADAVERALNYIHTNYGRDISLSEVAGHVCLSPTYFSTLFTRTAGTNFSDYLRTYRLERAKTMLSSGSVSVQEIAARVGFRSSAYFIKNFSDAFGMTPGEFRKR